MPKIITLDKGSKRRLNQIRWKSIEVFSLALLAILLLAMSFLVLFSQLQHEHPPTEPTKVPQFNHAEPEEP
jgi:hypothetical protein